MLEGNGVVCGCPMCVADRAKAAAQVQYVPMAGSGPIRSFSTGATRDSDTSKLDFEGFLSPLVLNRFAAYMHQHRIQADGSLRDSDNWQKGIPQDVYMKSLFRHFMTCWTAHREGQLASKQDDLCAMLFNVQGLILEVLKETTTAPQDGLPWLFSTSFSTGNL